jgi:hypothetical protein
LKKRERQSRRGRKPCTLGKNVIEDAILAYNALFKKGLSESEAAKHLGRSRGWLILRLKLLQLPSDVQNMVRDGSLPFSLAGYLTRYSDSEFHRDMAHVMRDMNLDSREGRKLLVRKAEERGIQSKRREREFNKIIKTLNLPSSV